MIALVLVALVAGTVAEIPAAPRPDPPIVASVRLDADPAEVARLGRYLEVKPGETLAAERVRHIVELLYATGAYADVVVVSITAPPNVLAERVAMRARSSDGMVEGRLRRTVEDASAAPDVTIVNISSAEYHARQLVRVIKGEKWDD